jgi:hypothetical protein
MYSGDRLEREVDRIPRLRIVEFHKIKTVKPLRSGDEIRYGIVYAVVPKEFIGKTAIVYIFIIRESTIPLERVVP